MKKLNRMLPLLLAGLLQALPMIRSVLPAMQNAVTPTWAYIFPWVAGSAAFLGYDAVSSASGIAISPPTATIGVFYSGTVTYSGGHADSVISMSLSNSTYSGGSWHCLASGAATLAPGLTISYSGGNTAAVSGTPTGIQSTNLFRLIPWNGSGCGGNENDTREDTTLIILPVGGAQYAPSFASQPQNDVAQIGSTVILSGGAVGNPTPQYSWLQGLTPIPGATNNTLTIPNVQLTNAGVYTLVASNVQGKVTSPAYLSVCETPGANTLALQYTNYVPAGTALTMDSFLTNVPAATTYYSWDFNLANIGVTTPNLTISASQLTPLKSGTYSVFFYSTNNGTVLAGGAEYDSYWAFGYVPGFTNSPASVTTNSGATVTLKAAVTGTTPAVSWYQNGILLTNETLGFNPASAAANLVSTNATLVLSGLTVGNAGTYTVVVTNSWGSITSAPAILTISSPVAVTTPVGETNYVGNSISLSATATGSGTLNYQWLKGGASVLNGSTVSGANTTNLVIAPAVFTNSGNYSIVVTNTSGSVTSAVAVVSIVAVPTVSASVTGGNLSLTSTGGIPNRNYLVESTTNLASPIWQPVLTNQASSRGVISFTGTNGPGIPQEFFQLEFP